MLETGSQEPTVEISGSLQTGYGHVSCLKSATVGVLHYGNLQTNRGPPCLPENWCETCPVMYSIQWSTGFNRKAGSRISEWQSSWERKLMGNLYSSLQSLQLNLLLSCEYFTACTREKKSYLSHYGSWLLSPDV